MAATANNARRRRIGTALLAIYAVASFVHQSLTSVDADDWEAHDYDYDEADADEVSRRLAAGGRLSIVHVVSPYWPLDDDRSLALDAVARAKSNPCLKGKSRVRLVAAVHPRDVDAVPSYFDGQFVINRFYEGRYPVLQDMFDGALADYDFDYLVYTNADIVVHPDFYCAVGRIVRKQRLDAFAINRKTVPKDTTLDQIAAGTVADQSSHPGDDCWILKRTVLRKINTGDTFVGFPPFASELTIQMNHHAARPGHFKSFALAKGGTYHRGDDRTWAKGGHKRNPRKYANHVATLCGTANKFGEYCDAPKNRRTGMYCRSLKWRSPAKHRDREAWCKKQTPVAIDVVDGAVPGADVVEEEDEGRAEEGRGPHEENVLSAGAEETRGAIAVGTGLVAAIAMAGALTAYVRLYIAELR